MPNSPSLPDMMKNNPLELTRRSPRFSSTPIRGNKEFLSTPNFDQFLRSPVTSGLIAASHQRESTITLKTFPFGEENGNLAPNTTSPNPSSQNPNLSILGKLRSMHNGTVLPPATGTSSSTSNSNGTSMLSMGATQQRRDSFTDVINYENSMKHIGAMLPQFTPPTQSMQSQEQDVPALASSLKQHPAAKSQQNQQQQQQQPPPSQQPAQPTLQQQQQQHQQQANQQNQQYAAQHQQHQQHLKHEPHDHNNYHNSHHPSTDRHSRHEHVKREQEQRQEQREMQRPHRDHVSRRQQRSMHGGTGGIWLTHIVV
jgi:hypothetical protein